MSFSLPADLILPVRAVDVRLDRAPHPFETANAEAIERNWRQEAAETPALFDGRVALLSSLGHEDGILRGRCHIVRYATFMLWRRQRPVGGVVHAYAHAVLVSADGALLAIRMAKGTVNAGKVYFASGTFEEDDFRDGTADPELNMRREVLEETGFDLDGVPREARYHVVSKDTGTVLFRRYFLPVAAQEFAERVRAHVATEREPEIDGPVVIRSERDLPEGLAPQMPDLIRWHFATPPAPG